MASNLRASKESFYYGSPNPLDESIITTQLMWGGEAKKGESRKSRTALEKKIDMWATSPNPKAELRGSGSKGAGRELSHCMGEDAHLRRYTPEGTAQEARRGRQIIRQGPHLGIQLLRDFQAVELLCLSRR